MAFDQTLQRIWYGRSSALLLLLIPLSWIFQVIVVVRRIAYEKRWIASTRVRVPVIVVGNITVGGTGKTPFSMWLAQQLIDRGLRVGIVLRGYGGKAEQWPQQVDANSNWRRVGDEAVLIASQVSGAIVVTDPNRVRAAEKAIELGADIIISDDGLQHYRLQRDVEILVVDEQRRFGNGRLLPAGPLREPVSRHETVDLRVISRRIGSEREVSMQVNPALMDGDILVISMLQRAHNLFDQSVVPLERFRGSQVHAVAAIGNPAGFFNALRAHRLNVIEHAYRDHAELMATDIAFPDGAPVLMTQKDAVKCRSVVDHRHWSVPLEIQVSSSDSERIASMIERIIRFRGRPHSDF